MKRNYSLFKTDSISGICKDSGQVILATMILEPTMSKTPNLVATLLGIGLICAFWSIGLALSSN